MLGRWWGGAVAAVECRTWGVSDGRAGGGRDGGGAGLRRSPGAARAALAAAAHPPAVQPGARGAARALRLAIHERAQRGHEAQVVEHGRPQLEREIADLLERAIDDLQALRKPRILRRVEVQPERAQGLSDLVVQLARHAPSLGLL